MKRFYPSKLIILIAILTGLNLSVNAQTSTFVYTGGVQPWTSPAGVTSIAIDAQGAIGGQYSVLRGGYGGRVQCTMNITPSTTYYIYVGGQGTAGGAGFNGGGTTNGATAGGGGGATDFRTVNGAPTATNRLMVAGGGGGGTANYGTANYDRGGNGGGLTGEQGYTDNAHVVGGQAGGGGGTSGGGGAGGTYPGYTTASPGTVGQGGAGGTGTWGTGGGGGYYGGGGGSWTGGGGGSSYTDPVAVTAVSHTQGFNTTGNGVLVITILCNSPGTITGNAPVCAGNTFTLSNTTGFAGGTWSSNTPTVATINSSGLVTGVAAGTSTITYTVPNPCGALATTVVTVNPLPLAIGGASSVCTGALTILTETNTGGIWSSTNASAATVDAFGNVSGAGIGTTNILYTFPTTCFVSKPVTVNNSPGPITGVATVCQGAVTPLNDVPGGGIWSSSSPSIANVDTTGHVTGIGAPNLVTMSTISYTLANGCTTSRVVTVNPIPQAFTVGGGAPFCAGTTPTVNVILVGSGSGISYQLYNGPTSIGAPLAGGGGALNFGPPPGAGTYTVIGTNTTTGCTNTMNASASVTVKPLPVPFTVTEVGNSYCFGGSGVAVGLSSSATSVSYQLFLGGSLLEAMPGTGAPVNFGFQFSAGSYTVVAVTTGASPVCTNNMIGSASITINPLPTPDNVTGGGAYCGGGTGVPIGLDFSSPGIYYVLYNGATVVDTVSGTGGAISFGLQTATGSSYTVIATNVTTGCTNNMTGTASVSIAPPPTAYTVTGGGSDCAGTNFIIGLSGSDPGVNYQLFNGAAPVGAPVPGLPGAFNFGLFDVAGTYSVVATDQTYHCTSSMSNSVTITENPLPLIYNVTGGGSYCTGGAGLAVMLDGSQIGVRYYLYNGGGLVSYLNGTLGTLNFGLQTAGGSYTIVAVDQGTSCTSTMAGSATITIDPLPIPYNVTGGGNYCAGGAGIDLGLDFSTPGVNYQLYIGGIASGSPIAGTGVALDFGYHTAAGTYTVAATNPATTCNSNMSGSATIIINALPALHTVSGGGSYCVGDAGRPVSISGSNPGISYQLYNGGTTAAGAPMAGTGSVINFGLQTLAGTYTVVATDTLTLCTRNMPGVATIVVNPIPGSFTVTGGGIYCEGGAGMHIGLSGSNAGVHYYLYNGGTLVSTLTGSGTAVDFGAEAVPGTYTVAGTNAATGCSNTMAGDAIIAVNGSPSAYTVTGGGSYCTGSSVMPSVSLSSSNSGINYQLYRSGTATGAPVTGTGATINFGTETAAGIYTVVATDATTGCTKNMPGSATVTISPLPTVYSVTGGGNYCVGGAGYHIYMSNSSTGVQYQLFNGSVPVDTISGTGAGVDFGLQSLAGTYTAVAVNALSGCTSNMAGSAVITINSLPVTHAVTMPDGSNYCATGSGVHVGLDGSNSGVNYQLFNGTTHVGTAMGGTGSPINFGIHGAGNYTVVATNAATGCMSNMTGSALINAIPLPNIYALTGGGNYCTTGLGLHVGLSGSDAGTVYQLYKGTSAIGIPVTGTIGTVDFGLFTGAGSYTVVASNGGALGCTSNMSGSAVITVYPVVIPSVSIATAGGDTICVGSTANFTASTINGGTSPSYSWSVNGVPTASGGTFSYTPIDGDMVTVNVQSDGICAIPDTASQTIRLTVSPPELPSVHLTAVPGDIVCQGTTVTFSGTTMYSGFNPTYTWLKNGVTVATSGLSYTYIPLNNDIVVLMMASSFPCRILDTVFSNPNTMKVDPPLIPIVTIKANPGTQIAVGESVTLTATVIYGGAAPTYQWRINGIAVNGATGATFTSSSLNNNDSVTCEIIGACDLKGFNSVRIHVSSEGVQQITASGSDNVILVPNPNKGAFTIKGTVAAQDNEEATIEVTNMLGQMVYSNKVMIQNANINEKIQLSNSLANGMYILNLRSGSQNSVFHFVIEQ